MRDIQHKISLRDEIDIYMAEKNIELIKALRTDAKLREFIDEMTNDNYNNQSSSQSNS